MKSTIKDVADMAGVSIKTVSRVINKEGSVRADTLLKVNEAIQTLNYQPSSAARNLAGTQSFTLGFVYDNPNAYYVIDMQNGILAECRERGYELIIHPCSSSNPNIVDEITTMVRRSQVAGLIISPPLSEMPEVLSALDAMGITFIWIISGSGEQQADTPCVYIHDHDAAFDITEHLISQQHQRIAFISGDKGHRSTDERLNGFKTALQKHHISLPDDYVLNATYSFDSGVKGAKQLLSLPEPPTAIFCCNDEIAAGALFAARLNGVDVPSQVAIAGFEDSPFSRQTWPKLTTAAQPTNVIARKAALTLIQHLLAKRSSKGQKVTIEHQHFLPELVVRESTQPISE